MQELVQLTWVFSRSFSMPCASFSMNLNIAASSVKHWKRCIWQRKASTINSSKLNKLLHSEVNLLVQQKSMWSIKYNRILNYRYLNKYSLLLTIDQLINQSINHLHVLWTSRRCYIKKTIHIMKWQISHILMLH